MADEEALLDVRGLKCPLPALLVRRRLRLMPAGAKLLVLADDPMAAIDIPHMCREEGFDVLTNERRGTEIKLALRRP